MLIFSVAIFALLIILLYFLYKIFIQKEQEDVFVLRSLGANNTDLLKFIIIEQVILVAISGIIGSFISYFAVKLMLSSLAFGQGIMVNISNIILSTITIIATNIILLFVPIIISQHEKTAKIKHGSNFNYPLLICFTCFLITSICLAIFLYTKQIEIQLSKYKLFIIVLCAISFIGFSILSIAMLCIGFTKILAQLSEKFKSSSFLFTITRLFFNRKNIKILLSVIIISIFLNTLFLTVNTVMDKIVNQSFAFSNSSIIMNGDISDYVEEINQDSAIKSSNDFYLNKIEVSSKSGLHTQILSINGSADALFNILPPEFEQYNSEDIRNISGNTIILCDYFREYMHLNVGDTVIVSYGDRTIDCQIVAFSISEFWDGSFSIISQQVKEYLFSTEKSNMLVLDIDENYKYLDVLSSLRQKYLAVGISVFTPEEFFNSNNDIYLQLIDFVKMFSYIVTAIVLVLILLAYYLNDEKDKEQCLKLKLLGITNTEYYHLSLLKVTIINIMTFLLNLLICLMIFPLLQKMLLCLKVYTMEIHFIKNLIGITLISSSLLYIYETIKYFCERKPSFSPILRKHW